MRVSQDEKERSGRRIVDSASRLFRKHGIDGASVGDVMKDAGMTHGGFYRHFSSKDALVVAALEDAFSAMFARVNDGLKSETPAAVGRAFWDFYLSEGHVATPETGCPAAALSGDVGRAPEAVKGSFGAGVRSMISSMAQTLTGRDRTRAATREFATMVGAVILARASDAATAQQILAACGSGPDNAR